MNKEKNDSMQTESNESLSKVKVQEIMSTIMLLNEVNVDCI